MYITSHVALVSYGNKVIVIIVILGSKPERTDVPETIFLDCI
jgi:hypothetical protein